MYFAKTAAGTWNVYAGTSTGTATLVGQANFDSSGKLLRQRPHDAAGITATTTPFTFNVSIPTTDGSSTPQNLTLNIAGTTQYGGKDGVNSLQPDGFAAGTLTGFTIGADGTLTGNYSNGQTSALGQIVLANFANQNGLVESRQQRVRADLGFGRRADLHAGLDQPRRAARRRGGKLERRSDERTGEPDHRATQLSGERADDQDPADRRPDPDQPVSDRDYPSWIG